jgi:predicted DCC family thiol-disulfide oxidoreductase YuxK
MPRTDTIFFDGQCGMCRRSTRLILKLDWLHRLTLEDFTALPPEQLPASPEVCLQSMTLRTHDNRVLIGMPAVRRAIRRTPLGLLPALFLYIPVISNITNAVYKIIARNRKRDSCQM